MLMPKKNRMLVYEQLFRDGVIVAEKDCIHHLKQHKYVDVPNIHVIMTLKSLRSRNYVKEQFAWHHYYWYLTNEGIQYLREVLHLPAEIVPATLKRSARAPTDARGPRRGAGGDEQADGGARAQQGDRDAYRRGPTDKAKDVGAGAAENISFRGGFGRGSGGRPAAAEARPGAE